MIEDLRNYKDVDIFQQELKTEEGKECGKLYVLRGGWTHSTPSQYMDSVVSLFEEGKLHNQFIEINLDIPQVRVIIEGINELDYKPIIDYINGDK